MRSTFASPRTLAFVTMFFGAAGAACGGGGVSTPPATAHETQPASEAVPPPPEAAANACGGFEQRALQTTPTPLLNDRLQVRVPEGAMSSAPPATSTATEQAIEMETRVFLGEGDKQLVVISEELGALAPPALTEKLKAASPRLAQATFRELTLPSGLKVVLATHDQLPEVPDAVPLAHAFSTLADGTLQATRIFVSPAVMAGGGKGCVDFAVSILSTLAPGKHVLDLSAGTRKLGSRFELAVPQGTLIAPQRGPDFNVYRVLVVRELGSAAPQMGIYVGTHPSYAPEPSAKPIPGKLLGKPVTWLETTTNGVVERETLLKLPDVSLHLFMAASDTADAEALTKTAGTLRELEAPASK
ncbi:MAG TPA: hypothetical protein VFU02_08530 [Polyangiaceae bacterium]|nr:hypothetical protein [Polyangiaceae bacterium]